MNAENFDKEMQRIVESVGEEKPKLLLHSCCGPCSSYCIEELDPHFFITVFYYNPNIDTDEEYEKRKAEQKRFIERHPWQNPVSFVGEEYRKEDFEKIAKGKENCKEGGEPCLACYRLRLEEAAKYARNNGFDFFTTTLTVSPLKNAAVLNRIGFELQEEYGVKFLPTDFKKRGGYQRSVVISKEYEMYRQEYCGCEYSKKERENQKKTS